MLFTSDAGVAATTELIVPAGIVNVYVPTTVAVAFTVDANVNTEELMTVMTAVTLNVLGVAPEIVTLVPVVRLCAALVTVATEPFPTIDVGVALAGTAVENVNVNDDGT
jgi:hypothetical protein